MARFIDATRVWLACPCGNLQLMRAANATIVALLEEPDVQEWGGFTYSSLTPPVFFGQFWNEVVNGQPWWEEDQNVLIMIDAPGRSLSSILDFLIRLRDKINTVYAQVGQPQKALWITAHPLSILWD